MRQDWENYWPEFEREFRVEANRPAMPTGAFIACVKDKLKRGAREYRDQGFIRNPSDVIAELKEECVDLCGWALLLWSSSQDVWVKRRALVTASRALFEWKYLCDTEHYMNNPDPANDAALRRVA